MNHQHLCVCEHREVRYCKHCQVVYCLNCNMEWRSTWWTYTYNPVTVATGGTTYGTTVSGGTTTFGGTGTGCSHGS